MLHVLALPFEEKVLFKHKDYSWCATGQQVHHSSNRHSLGRTGGHIQPKRGPLVHHGCHFLQTHPVRPGTANVMLHAPSCHQTWHHGIFSVNLPQLDVILDATCRHHVWHSWMLGNAVHDVAIRLRMISTIDWHHTRTGGKVDMCPRGCTPSPTHWHTL